MQIEGIATTTTHGIAGSVVVFCLIGLVSVLGREAGEALWRELEDFEAIWMEADGSIWLTPGLEDLAEGDEFRVIAP